MNVRNLIEQMKKLRGESKEFAMRERKVNVERAALRMVYIYIFF